MGLEVRKWWVKRWPTLSTNNGLRLGQQWNLPHTVSEYRTGISVKLGRRLYFRTEWIFNHLQTWLCDFWAFWSKFDPFPYRGVWSRPSSHLLSEARFRPLWWEYYLWQPDWAAQWVMNAAFGRLLSLLFQCILTWIPWIFWILSDYLGLWGMLEVLGTPGILRLQW